MKSARSASIKMVGCVFSVARWVRVVKMGLENEAAFVLLQWYSLVCPRVKADYDFGTFIYPFLQVASLFIVFSLCGPKWCYAN